MRESNINERLEICKKCPICKNNRCSSDLWINPDTNEISREPKSGYKRGCGCFLSFKVKNPNNHCIAGKW